MWLWVLLALILSYLPLKNKKIDLPHYMWLLMPIDAYGISVAGAIIKPYMIFALILTLLIFAKNKDKHFHLTARKSQLFGGFVCLLIILVNLVNNDSFSSVKAAIMALIVYVCALLYTFCTDCSSSEQLSDVFIASCFGCAVIFIFAYICMNCGLNIGGLIAQQRSDAGMFMQSNNMSNGFYIESLRLRGFAYDPNTMFIQFVFGISACVQRLFKKFNLYYAITLVISIFCVILSSSRMGLICVAATIIITSAVGISQFKSTRKKLLTIIAIMSCCIILIIVSLTASGQAIFSNLLSTYSNRSSLTDEYGRFSIWKECLSIYWENNPVLGVGLGRIEEYTLTERMTHNTWLQFICECGIIVGLVAIIYFLTVMIIGWSKVSRKHRNDPDNTSYLTLVIGYTVTIISLISVDNITCSYLWFSAILLQKLAYYYKPTNKKVRLTK